MTTSSGTADGRGRALARNTFYNLLGQAIPLLVGVVAIPVATHFLGAARFGLLALIWAMLGYAVALDLGLGRATTKYVAEYLSLGSYAELRRVTGLTVASQTALGALGGLGLGLASGWLTSVLGIPAGLHGEARAALIALAVSVPFVALSASLRGVLEGAQRFDLANLIRAPLAVAGFAVPAVAAPLGATLPTIVLVLLGVRLVACWALARAVRRSLPEFRWELRPSWAALRPLLAYGGWVSVSNAIAPLLSYLERFLLASLAGVAAVAYYAAPFEAVTRLLIVPASLAGALFPLVSAIAAHTEPGRAPERLVGRAFLYLLPAVALPAGLVALFSSPLLRLWLGDAYAANGAAALAILAAGVVVNGLAHLPHAYLLARGRPDVPAMFHLLELPLYAAAAWLLIESHGIAGAALAWTLRVTVDAALLGGAMWWMGHPVRPRAIA
jgi:O-antigen/teichoic acid export membrane protein